jgi:hypothetical protein
MRPTRQCILVVAACLGAASAGAHAEDRLSFSFERIAEQGRPALWLRGEIAEGDLGRLQHYLRDNAGAFAENGGQVAFAIDGGDMEEAMRLGDFLRDSMMEARLPDVYRARCVSACFFLFAGAVSRHAAPDTVAIHRPHFDAADLARARASAARERYDALFVEVRAFLDRMQVPRILTETLLAIPGNETYRLTPADLEQLGATQAWFEDYSAARCAFEPGLAGRLDAALASGREADARELREELNRAEPCVADLRRQQRLRVIEALGDAD